MAEGINETSGATQSRRQPPRLRALVVGALVLGGLSQGLVLPPVGWWWLSPISLVPPLWAVTQLRGRWALAGGWLWGSVAAAVLHAWITPTVAGFAGLPLAAGVGLYVLHTLASGAQLGVLAWGLDPLRRAAGPAWPFAFAAWWVALELVTPQVFPYYQGAALYQQPSIFLVSALTGLPGLSFLIVLSNAIVLWGLERALARQALVHRPLIGAATATALLVLGGLAYSAWRSSEIEAAQRAAPARRIALVQSNLDAAARRELSHQGPTAVLDELLRLSSEALHATPGIDALVWPEGALPGSPDLPRNRRLLSFVRERGVEVWTGGHVWERHGGGMRHRHNSAFRVFGAGQVDERYDKSVLLPFGEYLPGAKLIPWLGSLRLARRNTPGDGVRIYDTPAGRFAFLICYEGVQHRYIREAVAHGADLLVHVTYDGWFGDTWFPHQHLAMAAAQSAQYGVPAVRAASTGISAFIDARGVIVERSGLFAPQVMVVDVPRIRRPGLYAELGDWFGWGCVVVSLGLTGCGWRRRRARRRGAAPPP